MNRKALVLLPLLFALLAGLALFTWPRTAGKPETLAALGPTLGLDFPGGADFRLGKNLLRQAGKQTFRSVEASRGSRILKLEIITGLSPEQAGQALSERLNMIETLFSNVPTPYPGLVTNTVAVPETISPRRLTLTLAGRELPLYLLAASERKTYGVMAAEQVAFRAAIFFLYVAESQTFYRCDYFIPLADFSEAEPAALFSGLELRVGKPGLISAAPGQTGTGPEIAAPLPAVPPSPAADLRHPGYNLILIAFEPLGANHVGAYGYDKKTTPNLDAFARESFLFSNAVSTSSWTLPAFMSWFTSLYPEQHRVVNKFSRFSDRGGVLSSLEDLAPGTITLTQVLRAGGYRTAAFTGGASLVKEFGFGLGFEQYEDEPRFAGFDRTMPRALDWLREHPGEKFFLFVQGYDVHGQFPLRRENLAKFLDPPYLGPAGATEQEYWALRDRNLEEGGITLPPEDLRLWQAVYDTKIHDADQRFGAFIENLRQLGLLDNSIVVVSSGSGNEYLEHGRIDHGFSLYEELTRVPLLIRVPGRQGRIASLVRTLDLMPTVLDLLALPVNAKVREQMRGVSLVPLLNGETLALDAVSATDYLQRAFKRAIKTSDGWKFILSLDTEQRELYNLADDPGERRNLARDDPRRAYELEQRMFKLLRGEKTGD